MDADSGWIRDHEASAADRDVVARLLFDPCHDLALDGLPDTRADRRTDGRRRKEWRGEQPHHEPRAAERHRPLPNGVVLLLDRDVALEVLAHDDEPDYVRLAVPDG